MTERIVATVIRERFKYAIAVSPWAGHVQICVLTFWRRKNAQLYADTLNAAFQNGIDVARQEADRAVRRPDVIRMTAQLRAKNPTWSEKRLLAHAKAIVTGERFYGQDSAGDQK